jgi:hypothetical protein
MNNLNNMFLVKNDSTEMVIVNKNCIFIKELFQKMKKYYDPELYIWTINSKWHFGFLRQEMKKFCNDQDIKAFLMQYPEFLGYFI